MTDPQPYSISYPSRRAAVAIAKRRSVEDAEPWTVVTLLRHKGWHTAMSSRLLAAPSVATTEPYRTVAVFAQGRQV